MEKIIWNKKFNTGIKELDEQHKQIIKVINTLIEKQNTKVDSEIISDILTKLIEYARNHFKKEEQYMIEFNYSEYLSHKEQHLQRKWYLSALIL